MRHLILLFVAFCFCGLSVQSENVFKYADPFVGTSYTGHTTPAAAYPLGFVQPGPQTGNFNWKYCGGYNYDDTLMEGFSQNHINGTGSSDLGDILMMPFCKESQHGDFKSGFDKKKEKAWPGYYTVDLSDNQTLVELTCTPHVAYHRYTFHEKGAKVYVNFQSSTIGRKERYFTHVLESDYKEVDHQTLVGGMKVKGWVNRHVYYAIKFSKPFTSVKPVEKDPRIKAPINVYSFDIPKGSRLLVKVALSTVSQENALQNMNAEAQSWNFDAVRKEVEKAWAKVFSKISMKGTEEQKRNVYTSLYHLYYQPNNIADVNGEYRGADDKVNKSTCGKYYSTLSLWDTYRAAQPLYTILSPTLVSEIVQTMLLHSDAVGYLPIWALWGKENFAMIGNHAVPVVVEAALKNLPGFDKEKAFQAVKKSLTTSHFKADWVTYNKYEYYPYDLFTQESVSQTLETAYDDYCAWQLAQKMGKKEEAWFFQHRSMFPQHLFDPETKLMRGKGSDGLWRAPFDKFGISHYGDVGGDYTEGNAWQYTWHMQQDPDFLIRAMGGEDAFCMKLDSLFTINEAIRGEVAVDVTGLIGQYAHGNEPSHHVIYFYTMAGRPWRTAELVREVFDKFYLPKTDGLCGNDDCGQMSAWYLFSAFGFYPVNTVNGEYIIGAPQLPQCKIRLENGNTFEIVAHGISKENKYVKSIRLNGRPISNWRITYDQIMAGGRLEFDMTNVKSV